MGRLQAAEMANLADLDTALTWHLQHNHYPPVPLSMLPICKAAIKAGNEEDWNREIELPEGVSYQGRPTAPAHQIITSHHLEAFLVQDGEEENEN